MGNGDGLRRAVSVFAEDQVGLTAARVVTLEGIRPVQQDDHVRILFQTVVNTYAISRKIMHSFDGSVVDVMLADTDYLHDAVPEHIVGCEIMQLVVVENG